MPPLKGFNKNDDNLFYNHVIPPGFKNPVRGDMIIAEYKFPGYSTPIGVT